MLGKDVVVDRIGTSSIETTLGTRQAYEYQLYPGGSYLYVDTQPPHPILMLSQRIEGQVLDALLIRMDEEADQPQQEQRDAINSVSANGIFSATAIKVTTPSQGR